MLTGPGVDERHSCSCSGAGSTLLADGLGSALALTDPSGAVQTQYTYDAFGKTTSSGSVSSNTSQYTGRDNDNTGLYYYRARYYSPALQRFISEDPIGFAGGDANLYAYVANNPVNFSDPLGTNPAVAAAAGACLEGAIINAAVDALIDTLAGRKITASGIARSAVMGCGLGIIAVGLGPALGAVARAMRASRAARAGADAASEAPSLARRMVGREYPTKTGAGGRPQPYNPANGQYVKAGPNTGLAHSPVADLGIGLAEGYASALTPGRPSLPSATSGPHFAGQVIGYIFGYLAGPR
jgi:RHS repeat-associated protein